MDRLLRRLPARTRSSFTHEQIDALAAVLAGRYAAPTLVDWRRSIRCGPRGWYLSFRVRLGLG